MQGLVRGALTFRRHMFSAYRDLFQRLAAEGQQPQALFIGCSDSRVVPNLITMSDPGDPFIMRNVGNLVPLAGSDDVSVASAVEYALEALSLSDIVLCGHSRCGAMRALLQGGPLSPALERWLRQARESLDLLERYFPELADPDARLDRL